MNTLLLAASILFAATVSGFAQSASGAGSPDVLKDLAPTGKLRAAINFGNSVLAQKDEATGQPKGISPDLARELGRRLGVPVELVIYEAAGKVFDAAKTGAWDIGFIAIEPVRVAEIEFTAPYVIIEGGYMVPKDSAAQGNHRRRSARRAHRRRSQVGLRPLSYAHDQERHRRARVDGRRESA